jgi:hypothetical protein
MSRRFQVALAMAAFAAAVVAHAENPSDRACTRDGVAHLVPAHDELAALFARSGEQTIVTENGTIAPMGPPEVLMARVGPDGRIAIVCVDSETAARRFLEAPDDSLARKKEQ